MDGRAHYSHTQTFEHFRTLREFLHVFVRPRLFAERFLHIGNAPRCIIPLEIAEDLVDTGDISRLRNATFCGTPLCPVAGGKQAPVEDWEEHVLLYRRCVFVFESIFSHALTPGGGLS